MLLIVVTLSLPVAFSLRSKRLHRIDLCRAAGGQPAGKKRDDRQNDDNRDESQRVERLHFKQEATQEARRSERTGES